MDLLAGQESLSSSNAKMIAGQAVISPQLLQFQRDGIEQSDLQRIRRVEAGNGLVAEYSQNSGGESLDCQ
jgi:hypothetical protein